jgi:hypothetical protein
MKKVIEKILKKMSEKRVEILGSWFEKLYLYWCKKMMQKKKCEIFDMKNPETLIEN